MTVQENTSRHHIERLLRDNEDGILDRWVQISNEPLLGRVNESETRRELHEIYRVLLQSLSRPEAASELRGLLAELSRNRARQGFTPSETAVSVYGLKEAVYELIGAEQEGDEQALRGFIWLSRTIDGLGLYTFEAYSAARDKIISDQTEQLLELSTPVVKLWEGIVSVPLVGTLDSARTQVVMEKLLQTLVDTGSEYAVIDITGVPAVDTQVAQHLLKTVMAARLMGAHCVISGIRPQIAHTIVTLGIEFGDIVTKATLADALAYALRKSGVEVVNKRRTRLAIRAEEA
ncbi:STAS domain-containing protein [Sphaerisporangium album]|uniref:STAS domain-containing protein n=1 Tax=Sphaerisporangium album TaxID=509200 RepID=UPI001FE3D235|nr:STAS domain-containing protein [Sphaerisporangium album]